MATATYNSNSYSERRAVLPPDDPSVEADAGGNPPFVEGKLLLVKKGDIIDVGIDLASWCAANDAKLKSVSFAEHADSPESIVLTDDNGLDELRQHAVAIVDTTANTVGDTIWLNATVVVEDRTPSSTGYAFPDRTLVRTIALRVVL